jgi:hypothetical protein
MSAARTITVLVILAIVGVIGYQIGVSQNIAAQIPAGSAAPAYYYGPHPFGWGFGFGFGFLGLLFPLFFFFLIFGLLRAALWGGRGWGGGPGRMGWGGQGDWRRQRLEEIHRELHGDKPQSGGTSSTST